MNHRRISFRCRRRAEWLLVAALAASCGAPPSTSGDEDPRPLSQDLDAASAVVSARDDAGPAPTAWAKRYYAGYFAETLRGDWAGARATYAEVLAGASESDPVSAARAALRLANLELSMGNRRRAQELVARAASLGRDDVDILERADRAQGHIASLRSRGSEVRGPPAGTTLSGVSTAVQQGFAQGEALLGRYHRLRLEPRLEGLQAGIRRKQRAMEQALRRYREVIARASRPGEAVVAAEFRVASLHHDLALALMFDVPPELEADEAAKLRRSLRNRALTHLRKARAAYERALEAAGGPQRSASTERWRLVADDGWRAVKGLLVGRE